MMYDDWVMNDIDHGAADDVDVDDKDRMIPMVIMIIITVCVV